MTDIGNQVPDSHGKPYDLFQRGHVYDHGYVESGRDIFYQPFTPLNESSYTEFVVTPNGLDYIDMAQIRVGGRLKIVKVDDSNVESVLAATDDISVVNLFPSTLWKMVSVSLGGQDVQENSAYTYPWKVYLETLLGVSDAEKKTYMKDSSLWIADTIGKESTNTKKGEAATDKRTAYDDRADYITASKEYQFCIPLHVDLFQTQKLLLNGVSMRVKLIHNDPEFSILHASDNAKFKVKFLDLHLMVRSLTLAPSLTEKHTAMLSRQPAVYSFPMGKITTHTISTSTDNVILQNVCNGLLPSMCIIGFVDGDHFAGANSKNPFIFAPHAITSFYFRVNGIITPSTPYAPRFDNKMALRSYLDFVKHLSLDKGRDVGMTYESFLSNNCFYVLDCSGHACGQAGKHPPINGSVDVVIKFKTVPAKTIKMVIYSVHNQSISIDRDRNVTVAY